MRCQRRPTKGQKETETRQQQERHRATFLCSKLICMYVYIYVNSQICMYIHMYSDIRYVHMYMHAGGPQRGTHA